MATDEKYLDNLLKSLTENDQQSRTMEEAMSEVTQTAKVEDFLPASSDDFFDEDFNNSDNDMDALADLLAEALPKEENKAEEKELIKESDALVTEDDAFIEKNAAASDDMDDWQSSLDDLMAQADAQVKEESNAVDSGKMDALGLFDNMDADLEEINGLLKNTDNDEAVEDDILALLESFKDDKEGSVNSNSEEAFDIFAENALEEDKNTVENKEEFSEEKSKRKKLFSKEKSEKRKKKNKAQGKNHSKQTEEVGDINAEASVDEAVAGEEDAEKQEPAKTKEKHSFFSKMLNYLTQEEEELAGASDENAEILQELNEEDKQKVKKEEKKKKKADKKKRKEKADAEAAPEGEEAGDAEADEDKKKKKKEKKKKEKTPKDAATEKPVKVLSRKNLLVLIAACATLIASICVLSSFLPEYADKKNARQAFYNGDYEEAFRLLYDKNLNSSDSVIYNRVRTVLTIERKMKSYENNLAMNRELEALDALMQGISCYQDLDGVDEYGVRDEVDAIYQQICTILQDNYDITPEEALEINAYDNDTYTRKLHSVINGTEFIMPGQEIPQEELPPQDVLPEEEEIISY